MLILTLRRRYLNTTVDPAVHKPARIQIATGAGKQKKYNAPEIDVNASDSEVAASDGLSEGKLSVDKQPKSRSVSMVLNGLYQCNHALTR